MSIRQLFEKALLDTILLQCSVQGTKHSGSQIISGSTFSEYEHLHLSLGIKICQWNLTSNTTNSAH